MSSQPFQVMVLAGDAQLSHSFLLVWGPDLLIPTRGLERPKDKTLSRGLCRDEIQSLHQQFWSVGDQGTNYPSAS